MKKIIFIVLLGILSISAEKVSAQCIDTIGMSPASVQSGFLILAGWGVNELPNSYTWANLRRTHGEFRPGTGNWITVSTASQPNPCTGWMMAHIIDINTIHPFEVIEFQVFMLTSDGKLYSSKVSRFRGRKYPKVNHEFMTHPITKSDFQRNVSGEDESLLIQNSEISNPSISRIGRDFKIIDGSDQYKLFVFDVTGRLVIEKDVEFSSFTLSNENLPQGIYIIQLVNSEEKISERVFIE